MSGEPVSPGGPNPCPPASRRTAIVTGGTRGIGLEVARRLASGGANVVIAGTSATAGAAARHLVAAEAQGEVFFRQTDVGDAADAAGLVEWTVQQFSSLDVLVNSAGLNVREARSGRARSSGRRCSGPMRRAAGGARVRRSPTCLRRGGRSSTSPRSPVWWEALEWSVTQLRKER